MPASSWPARNKLYLSVSLREQKQDQNGGGTGWARAGQGFILAARFNGVWTRPKKGVSRLHVIDSVGVIVSGTGWDKLSLLSLLEKDGLRAIKKEKCIT